MSLLIKKNCVIKVSHVFLDQLGTCHYPTPPKNLLTTSYHQTLNLGWVSLNLGQIDARKHQFLSGKYLRMTRSHWQFVTCSVPPLHHVP